MPIHANVLVRILAAGALAAFLVTPAAGHGFAGKRFFPATLATDDPFVADELSLPTLSYRRVPGESGGATTRATDLSVDIARRITDDLGIEVGATYRSLSPAGAERTRGFDNLGVGVKYKFYQDDAREALLSAGIDWDIGGSGARRVNAESFSTVTPAVFFGKGFGDLPEPAQWLRPLAVTGLVGVAIPTRASSRTVGDDGDVEVEVERYPHLLTWGFAFEYSLQYLQANVRDIGLPAPFNRMIGVVELPLQTALDRGGHGTTGTVNPGVIWAGQYAQVGVEAVIPVNHISGSQVGWLVQLHFFLDDLFPQSLGRPLVRQ